MEIESGAFSSRYTRTIEEQIDVIQSGKEVKDKDFDMELKASLENIDKQVFESTEVYVDAQKHEGVCFAYGRASADKVIKDVFGIDLAVDRETTRESHCKVLTVIVPGIAPPNHMEYQGLLQYQMFRDLRKVLGQRLRGESVDELDYVTVAYPNSGSGGVVTERWLKEVVDNGFSAHGELYTNFLEPILEHGYTNVKFVSFSTGAAISEAIAAELQKAPNQKLHGDQIELQHHYPAGLNSSSQKLVPLEKVRRTFMYFLGFAEAAITHSLADTVMKSERTMREEEILNVDKKIRASSNFHESPSKTLNLKAVMADYLSLVRGTPISTDKDIRRNAIGGAFDFVEMPNTLTAAIEGIGALIRAQGHLEQVTFNRDQLRVKNMNGVRTWLFPTDHYEGFNLVSKQFRKLTKIISVSAEKIKPKRV